jgi:hypothetical protein
MAIWERRARAGAVESLARALVAPQLGDPLPTVDDLAGGLRSCAAARRGRPSAEATRTVDREVLLVHAARAGAEHREPLSWTRIAAALGEPVAVVMARHLHLVADPRTGPAGPEEAAAARAVLAAGEDELPPTVGLLRIP